ncbi:response regulator [Lyngbya aestuarii]|uniref:response regulator n=1 Tax=Lyngbya aestuarii TaxID=118322 RepID=UPI00403DEDA4
MVNSNQLLKSNPISLLKETASNNNSSYIQVTEDSVLWQVHFRSGKLTYACYSFTSHPLHSLTRLKYHLHSTGHKEAVSALENNVQELLVKNQKNQPSQYEYQAILWLLDQQYLTPFSAKGLVQLLVREAIEVFLSLTEVNYRVKLQTPEMQIFGEFELQSMIEECQRRLGAWQSLAPVIQSPHQRPYISSQSFWYRDNQQDRILPTVKQQLATLLKGYSIRHLAALLKQDELKIAKFLHPYVVNGSIFLRQPESPFDQLPSISAPIAQLPVAPSIQQKPCPLIACVDDSPNTLDEIERLLGKENFSFFKCFEPIKAAIVLRRINPDIILLDVGMPGMNGYELCRMLKNHPSFKKTPIIMVTGNQGFLSKDKAMRSGASDYLTKPFTRASLQAIVAKYLT